jgi:hypothetical protein
MKNLQNTRHSDLTLIQPGEVKVDLGNFDIKFRTKFLYIRLFFILPTMGDKKKGTGKEKLFFTNLPVTF